MSFETFRRTFFVIDLNFIRLKTVFATLLAFTCLHLSAQVKPERPPRPEAPRPKAGFTVLKPYWVLGDNREIAMQSDITVMIGDSVVSNEKAKWDGSIEVTKADGKNLWVSIDQTLVDGQLEFNDVVKKMNRGNKTSSFEVVLDKTGVILGVESYEEVRAKFIADWEKFEQEEFGKLSKEEKFSLADSLTQALDNKSMFKRVLMAYARNFIGIYGREIPTNTDTTTAAVELDPKRFFAEASKTIPANSVMYLSDIKGTKFTFNEELSYRYDGLREWILQSKITNPILEEATTVSDKSQTVYDGKVHWPQKINEEIEVKNGKYRILIKWSVKFNKPK